MVLLFKSLSFNSLQSFYPQMQGSDSCQRSVFHDGLGIPPLGGPSKYFILQATREATELPL